MYTIQCITKPYCRNCCSSWWDLGFSYGISQHAILLLPKPWPTKNLWKRLLTLDRIIHLRYRFCYKPVFFLSKCHFQLKDSIFAVLYFFATLQCSFNKTVQKIINKVSHFLIPDCPVHVGNPVMALLQNDLDLLRAFAASLATRAASFSMIM